MSPYASARDAKLPARIKALPLKTRQQWVTVWNDEYSQCLDDGGDANRCEGEAFRVANGAIAELATASGRLVEAATLKTRAQRLMRDMTAILALRDVPEAVRKEIEDVRAIFKRTWADLADEAKGSAEEDSMELGDIARVLGDGRTLAEVLQRSDDMPNHKTVKENGYEDEDEPMLDTMIGARSFADLRNRRAAEDMASMAEQLFYDFSSLVRGVWYDAEVTDKGTAIQDLAKELAIELGNLSNRAAETDTTAEDDAGHSDAEPGQGDAIGGDLASIGTDAKPDGETGNESGEEDDMAGQVVEEVRAQTEIKEDAIEKETEQLCESSDGAEVLSLGALAEAETSGPLTVKVKLIKPGAGNKADRHYYPASMLRRDARRFAGAKMYETDHKSEEKSTRTWVSTIRAVSEFDAEGSPVAEVVVHDPGFAERLRNLSAAAMLDRMECSILASGRVKEGQIDGADYRIVEAIEDVQSVDWVTRAGAGGQAVALAESEEGTMTGQPGEGDQPDAETVEVTEETEQELTVMAMEQVNAWLEEHANLPTPVVELLAERQYADEGALETAVTAMGKALAEQFGKARIRDNDAAKPQPKPDPLAAQQAYQENLSEVVKKFRGR